MMVHFMAVDYSVKLLIVLKFCLSYGMNCLVYLLFSAWYLIIFFLIFLTFDINFSDNHLYNYDYIYIYNLEPTRSIKYSIYVYFTNVNDRKICRQ